MDDDKPKTQKSTTTSEPWAVSQPLLKETIADATNLYRGGGLNYRYYPGETIAPLAPETTQAWSQIAERAQAGSPLTAASKGYYGDVLAGKYLGQESPGLSGVLGRARNEVNSSKIMSGRYGSGAHDAALGEAFAPIIYGDYARERDIQNQAAQYAPQLAAQDYADSDRLAQVGAARQGYGQDVINEMIKRFTFEQNAPANEIALAQALAGGQLGGTTTSTQPVQGGGYNPFMQFAGTALQTLPYFFGA